MNTALFQPPRRKIKGPGRVTKEVSDRVMWLHKRLNHCSPNAMALALRSQAWTGIDITAAQVEQVFRAHDCVTCMLSRSHRLHRTTGSGGGVVGLVVGDTISCDYVPLSITARGGPSNLFRWRMKSIGPKGLVSTSAVFDSVGTLWNTITLFRTCSKRKLIRIK